MQETEVSETAWEGILVEVVENVVGSHTSCPLAGAANLAHASVGGVLEVISSHCQLIKTQDQLRIMTIDEDN